MADIWAAVSMVSLILAGYGVLKYFNRDPERRIPSGPVILAPADGRIIDVVQLDATPEVLIRKGLFGKIAALTGDMAPGPLYLISIFMTPADVHVQRSPVSGKVAGVTYRPGRFRVTNSLRAIDNERAETLIDSPAGRIKVIQIAGLLARRIETWTAPPCEIQAGERLGRIAFGSQVSLLIPADEEIKVLVRKGQKVRAGETVLAAYREVV